MSKAIKARVKSAVSFVGNYEEQLKNFARKHDCVGIICGHIHTPDDKMIEDIHYLNSGDWVESLTALVEHNDGSMEVFNYKEFCQRLDEKARVKALKKLKAGEVDLDPEPIEEPQDALNDEISPSL